VGTVQAYYGAGPKGQKLDICAIRDSETNWTARWAAVRAPSLAILRIMNETEVTCPECVGSGEDGGVTCPRCHGSGHDTEICACSDCGKARAGAR
jgi:RecJ-like exonuclease